MNRFGLGVEKSASSARDFLQRTRLKMAAGAVDDALEALNMAMSTAPFRDDETGLLPLCFTMRSVLFCDEKRYFECIRDVDTALIYGLPPEHFFPLTIMKASCYIKAGRPRLALKSMKFGLRFFNVDVTADEVKAQVKLCKKEAREMLAELPVDVEKNTKLRPRYADREEMLRRMKGMIPTDGRKLGDVVVSSAVSLRRQDDEEIFFATRDVQAGKKAVP
jgi:hypothetical protein